MPDSTNNFVFSEDEKPIISFHDVDVGSAERVDLWLEQTRFHFSLILPKRVLEELVEKAQEFLTKMDSQDQAKEKTSIPR